VCREGTVRGPLGLHVEVNVVNTISVPGDLLYSLPLECIDSL
jgi:hypothetical protein